MHSNTCDCINALNQIAIQMSLSDYNLAISYLALGKKREAEKKLDILYMLDKSLYDSLDVRINSF